MGTRLHGLGVAAPNDEQGGARVEELRSALKDASAAQEALRKGKGGVLRTATLREATAAASAVAAEARCRTLEDENLRPLKAQLAELSRDGKSQAERDIELRAGYAARYEGEQKRDEARSAFEQFASVGDPAAELAELEHTAERLTDEATEAEYEVRDLRAALRRMSEQEPAAKLAELEEERERLRADFEERECSEAAVQLLQTFVFEAEARRVNSSRGRFWRACSRGL